MGGIAEVSEPRGRSQSLARWLLAAVAPLLWLLLWLFAHTDLALCTRAAQIVSDLLAFAVFCVAALGVGLALLLARNWGFRAEARPR